MHLLPLWLHSQMEKSEAELALSEAIPALEEAAAALNDLKRDDITEIRSFAKPHILVQKASHFAAGEGMLKQCGMQIRFGPRHAHMQLCCAPPRCASAW